MPDEQAATIRQMIMGIDVISDSEAHVAIQEFLHLDDATAVPADPYEGTSLELHTSLLTPSLPKSETPSKKTLSDHLESATDLLLVDLLRDEQPQTIAVVLSHVSAERASEIVARMSIEKQADVLQRIVEADRLSVKLDESIAEEFESWLIGRLKSANQRTELVSRLSKIVGAAPAETRQRILSNLATSDIGLSRDLGYEGEPEPVERDPM
jgi:flagellar motor switch protein FliG